MSDRTSPMQVIRKDNRKGHVGHFVGFDCSALAIDKVRAEFVSYDMSKPGGQRIQGNIDIYLGIYEAARLSRDILSGRIGQLGKQAQEKAAQAGKKYAEAVFLSQSGTPSKYRPDNVPLARLFTISPGATQPWVLCAQQGKGRETEEGLIVMDGAPEITIRVSVTTEGLKDIALAIEDIHDIWRNLRFVPIVAPSMKAAQDKRMSAIDQAKAESAEKAQGRSRQMAQSPQGQGGPGRKSGQQGQGGQPPQAQNQRYGGNAQPAQGYLAQRQERPARQQGRGTQQQGQEYADQRPQGRTAQQPQNRAAQAPQGRAPQQQAPQQQAQGYPAQRPHGGTAQQPQGRFAQPMGQPLPSDNTMPYPDAPAPADSAPIPEWGSFEQEPFGWAGFPDAEPSDMDGLPQPDHDWPDAGHHEEFGDMDFPEAQFPAYDAAVPEW